MLPSVPYLLPETTHLLSLHVKEIFRDLQSVTWKLAAILLA
ncbi:hypothetical protein J6590_106830, partial [Homalodisca vitripennis]